MSAARIELLEHEIRIHHRVLSRLHLDAARAIAINDMIRFKEIRESIRIAEAALAVHVDDLNDLKGHMSDGYG